jgi:hypothetical protein
MIKGVIVGIIISAVIWILGFTLQSETAFAFALWAAGIKYVAALALLFFRDWRLFAAGLFISLPVGVAIFFGVCTTGLMLHG